MNQKELKEQLHYDPETGIFTRLISNANCVKVGDMAGYINVSGYIAISIDSKKYLAHRLAWLYMTGEWPENQTDHIDHVRDNNKWDNLRKATNQENLKNQSIRKNNESGITGVCWHKTANKWMAYINLSEGSKYLGIFTDWFEAACARKSADNKYGFHENHGRI